MKYSNVNGKSKPLHLNDYVGISKKLFALRASLAQMQAINKSLVKAFNKGKQSLTVYFKEAIREDVVYFFNSKGFKAYTSYESKRKFKPYKLTISWEDDTKKSN